MRTMGELHRKAEERKMDYYRAGIKEYRDGSIYQGNFDLHGLKTGYGKMTYRRGITYIGQFLKGMRHGYGDMNYLSNEEKRKQKEEAKLNHMESDDGLSEIEELEPTFVNTNIDLSQQYIYKGAWAHDKKEGHGHILYEDKVIFEGIWKNGMMLEGRLVEMTLNATYNGYFSIETGLLEGKGDLNYERKFMKGFWKDSKLTGLCEIEHGNGDKEKGVYLNGKLEGPGAEITKSGVIQKGNCTNGMMNGKGIVYYLNGDIFNGNFKDGEPYGNGRMDSENGDVQTGWFIGKYLNG